MPIRILPPRPHSVSADKPGWVRQRAQRTAYATSWLPDDSKHSPAWCRPPRVIDMTPAEFERFCQESYVCPTCGGEWTLIRGRGMPPRLNWIRVS